MRLASAACSRCPVAFGSRVETYYNRRKVICQIFSAMPSSLHGKNSNSILCSLKASAGAFFCGSDQVFRELPQYNPPVSGDVSGLFKRHLMEESKNDGKESLISLGYDVVKWFLVTVLVVSFISDVFLAVSANREMLVPLGLFIGVMMADFLKESSHQFFENTEQRGNDIQKWGLGLLFVSIRFVFMSFRIRGWMLLSHISNGALMQIIWLANEQRRSLHDPERGSEPPTAPAETN
ncbi:hypothetical protein HPP92_006033 [Vanilla planifolia]|uniref:Uncharacterized protein n=1 Tax=Vanilla planifolia TaxID=51239 RepID=A0A835RHY5_VANPL|nr:hypothetical protein HPP92_006033 [Vanilla planifolia]